MDSRLCPSVESQVQLSAARPSKEVLLLARATSHCTCTNLIVLVLGIVLVMV